MLLTVTICLHNGLRTAADIYHCGELWNVLHVCRSHKLVVIAISLFCLNDPSKNDADAVDCCWSLLARSMSRIPVLMELFYQGSTLHDGRYFIFARTSRGRHISEAASGKERQDEMEYQPMGSSRATGVTKRRKTRFCSRVEERRIGIREGERGSEGWRETRKGLLGLFARRWDGDGFAWSGLARMHAPIARSQFAGECRIMNFFDKRDSIVSCFR